MKYLITIVLLVCAFVGGIYYENKRLLEENDKTIAVYLSKQARDNSNYQAKELGSYLELIEKNEYQGLVSKINVNIMNLKSTAELAANFCKANACNSEQLEYFER